MLLELDGHGSRQGQIARAVLQAIHDGTMPPGSRLPSTRQVAKELNCSRNIVVLAFEQLILEGYLVTQAKGGTFVSPELPRPAVAGARSGTKSASRGRRKPLSHSGQRLVTASEKARGVTRNMGRATIDFAYGLSEPDPRFLRRLRASFSTALRDGAFGYGDPSGALRLREQIAQRLRGSRGIVCSPAQIAVTNGAQQGLDLCARLLLEEGDRAVVEDPGYEVAPAAFAAAGATIVPVPVDDEGLDVSRLPKRGAVRLVYVTPSHQFPTGATLSAPRRHALLAWARKRGAFVIEDDYDGDLLYQGRPLKALAGLELGGDVIYCGTFAKSLFPAVRLGYLVLPDALAGAAVSAKWLSDRGSSSLLQRVVADLMISGEYERHLGRMRRRYATRRDALTRALTRALGAEVEIAGGAAGLHIVAWLPRLRTPALDALIARCADRGVGVYSVARHALRPLPRPGLILGYGMIDEQAIEAGVEILAEAYRRRRKR